MFGPGPSHFNDDTGDCVFEEPIHAMRNLICLGFIIPIAAMTWGLVYIIRGEAWIPDSHGVGGGLILKGTCAVALGIVILGIALLMHCQCFLCRYEKPYLLGMILSGLGLLTSLICGIYVIIQVAVFVDNE